MNQKDKLEVPRFGSEAEEICTRLPIRKSAKSHCLSSSSSHEEVSTLAGGTGSDCGNTGR